MEMRRQKDIVAFKRPGQAPVAFHARNLEVAEISDELWADLKMASAHSEAHQALQDWESENNPNVKSGRMDFGIRSLTINVTQICNLKCTYCAAGGDGTYGQAQTRISVEKTLPQLKFFLEKLPEGASFKIVFLGGEPLLYPEGIQAIAQYVQLMTAGRQQKTQFSIVTNGTLFSDTNVSLLASIHCNVTVSVDGPEFINDTVRPMKNGQGSTAAVIEGLQRLFKAKTADPAGLGRITLHGVFNESNMNLLAAYDFYSQFPADSYEFTYGVLETDPNANQTFIDQMEQVAARALKRGGEKALRQIGFFNGIFSALDEQQQTENFCGIGKSFLIVDARNGLYTCPWTVGKSQGRVGQGTQLDVAALQNYQQPLIEQNNCQTCWARYLCGGGCQFIHQQAKNKKKNEEFCHRMKSLITIAILHFKNCRESA